MICVSYRMAIGLPEMAGIDRDTYKREVNDGVNNVHFLMEKRSQIIETMEEIKKRKIKFDSTSKKLFFISLKNKDVYDSIMNEFNSAAGFMDRNTSKFAFAVYLVKNK